MTWEIAFSAKENRGKLSKANQVQQPQYVANKATPATKIAKVMAKRLLAWYRKYFRKRQAKQASRR